MFNTSRSVILSLCVGLAACAPAGSNVYQDSAVGGAGGAAAGAVTGAAVGAIIKNGSVAKSAMLGGVIGIPLGIAAGAAYNTYSQNGQISENDKLIQQNHRQIIKEEQNLESLRREIVDDSGDVEPSFERIEHQYSGPSLGNHNR